MSPSKSAKWTRREFLKSTSAALAVGMGVPVTGALAKESTMGKSELSRPNIIFVFSDQQRWDTVESYGEPIFSGLTPNLDKMASEGVRFEHAFTCQPVCGPARAVLQTGRFATEVGCYTNGIALPKNEKTLAKCLTEAGYEVGYIGKWHLAGHDLKNQPVPPELRGGYNGYWLASDVLEFTSHGYDGFMYDADEKKVEFKGYRADCETDFALEYLKTRDRKKPFLLFLSYLEPHHQNDHKHFEGPNGSKERYKDFKAPGDLKPGEGDWEEEMPDYLGCCANLDQNLGRIRKTLKELGLEENTVIIYTSDHGCHFRTRNKEYKRACNESAIHIPLIAYGPGFKGGKVVKELTSLIDLPPTVLTAAGVTPPKSMHGHPLQKLVNGSKKDWPKEVFVQISEDHIGRALRTAKWKYEVWVPHEEKGLGAKVENSASDRYWERYLYNLEKDPSEQNNLIHDPAYAAVRKELAETLKRHMAMANEAIPEILPAKVER